MVYKLPSRLEASNAFDLDHIQFRARCAGRTAGPPNNPTCVASPSFLVHSWVWTRSERRTRTHSFVGLGRFGLDDLDQLSTNTATSFLPPGGNLFHNMVSPLEREVPPAARGTRSHSPTHQASNRHRRRGGNEAIWVCRRVSVASLPAGLPPTEPTGTERNASQSHRSSTVVCVPATVCGR